MGVLLFTNGASPQIVNGVPTPGIGPTLYAFDLQKSKLIGPEVYPYFPSAIDGTTGQTVWFSEYVQNFTFDSNGDLYFIGLFYPTGESFPVQAIFKVSGNSYPIGFQSLNSTPIYKGDSDIFDISAVRVRQLSSTSGNPYRVYFSRSSGASGNWHIYYLDDSNNPVLYYTVKLNQIPARTCGGEGYGFHYWGGDFAFNDSGPVSETSTGTLYLSNGNYTGACIYGVAEAGLNSIPSSSEPVRLYPNDAIALPDQGYPSSVDGLQFVKDAQGREVLYFASEFAIYELELNAKKPILSGVAGISFATLWPFWDVSYMDSWSTTPKNITVPKTGQHFNPNRPAYGLPLPTVTGTITPPNPEPNERIVLAQEWVQQTLTNKTSRFGLKLTLSNWSHKLDEGTTGDRVSGTVRDQYGYLHAYDVQIAKDRQIQADESTVE